MSKKLGALALFFLSTSAIFPSIGYCLPDEYIKISISDGQKPYVDIDTNLPEGMQISVTVSPEGGGFTTGDDAVVHQGHVRVGPLTDHGSDLRIGPYLLQIVSPAAQFQDDPQVIAVLGEGGRNLNGPDVTEIVAGLGRSVRFERTFAVQ